VKIAAVRGSDLDEGAPPERGSVAVVTMHIAKGLEFKCVAVMACDDEIIPSQERIESVSDEADLDEVYDTERHLLYVACTRARSPPGDRSRAGLGVLERSHEHQGDWAALEASHDGRTGFFEKRVRRTGVGRQG
jgi:hypothetical protein